LLRGGSGGALRLDTAPPDDVFQLVTRPEEAPDEPELVTIGFEAGRPVSFNGERVRFQHVLQYLFLDAGHYRLQGRARTDSFKTERGLRWRMRCVGASALLAESEPFVGSDEWRKFTVDFTVPGQGCPVQLLRLELDGRVELDFEAQGGVWFDDLAIIHQS